MYVCKILAQFYCPLHATHILAMHCPQTDRLHSSQTVTVRLQTALTLQFTLFRSTPAGYANSDVVASVSSTEAGV